MFHASLQNFNLILHKKILTAFVVPDIVNFWKNNKNVWFSHKTIDNKIRCKHTLITNTLDFKFSLILQYDQLVRHPCKYTNHNNRHIYFKFATMLAFEIISSNEFNNWDDWKQVFTLLCIRHNDNYVLKKLVLKKIKKLISTHGANSIYLRFYQATIWDIHCYKQNNFGYKKFLLKNIVSDDWLKFGRILEYIPIQTISNNINEKNNFFKLCKKNLNCYEKFAVSISGGVDSMVISYYASLYAKKYNKKCILIHINYNNRKECKEEVEFLKYWSSLINTPIYVRTITEIKRNRNSKMRELYENITRKIRFSFYEYFKCPVILGHNKDDVEENIFSNIAKGIHFENLFGMSENSFESSVCLIRPMLTVRKSDIYKESKIIGIPYLCDSTPKWSNRGKMRDILLPELNKFNPNILKGLHDYIQNHNFLEKQWKLTFDEWFEKSVISIRKENITTISINKNNFFNNNYDQVSFWVTLWFHCKLPSRPTNRSFEHVIKSLKKDENSHNKSHILNKISKLSVSKDKIELIIQYNNS